ncbi:unnamed protein product [Heligmosomoides polygyrus]|uniref:Uncharacterized protein n=1 Tax=Heligmosomoides polygyrus TaxID=6339 RepID=A0A3P7YG05_HELPZ|nr:unnamed protein product [Heligmosomoides polygyrus]
MKAKNFSRYFIFVFPRWKSFRRKPFQNIPAAGQFKIQPFLQVIPPECVCVDDDGVEHDFCYRLPENESIRGRRFSCDHLPTVKSLGEYTHLRKYLRDSHPKLLALETLYQNR